MQNILRKPKKDEDKPRLLQDEKVADAINKINSPEVNEAIRKTLSELLFSKYDPDELLEALSYVADNNDGLLTNADILFLKIRARYTDEEVTYAVSWIERMLAGVIEDHVDLEPGKRRELIGAQGLEGIREPDQPPVLFMHRFDQKGRKWETMWIEPWKLALFYISPILEDVPDDVKVDNVIKAAKKRDPIHHKYFKMWKNHGVWAVSSKKGEG